MIGEWTNHLWQSTLFALAVWLLTIVLRENRAQVRYWLWLSASFKFLVPFSLLMVLASRVEWAPVAKKIASPRVSAAMVQIAGPFPDRPLFPAAMPGGRDWTAIAIFSVWFCGFAVIVLIRFRGWRRVQAALRASIPIDIPARIEVRACPGLLEPGVVGISRPVLLLPAGILEGAPPPQLEVVLAHELCHVRRHDNLFAAIHMVVEAIFWFHPLVWWIGARLVEERERACDEEVLRLGGEPQVYAATILAVCKHYLESPLVCVSGITGADLKKRIEAILAQRFAEDLTLAKKLLLAVGGIAAIAAPIAIGLLNAPVSRAQSSSGRPQFEVASIRPSNSTDRRPLFRVQPGGRLTIANLTVKALIRFAYDLKMFQLSGGPSWIDTELFDIAAKPEGDANTDQIQPMLQSLLAERFQLVVRRETKEMPVYALVIAKSGPKFKESKESDPNLIDLNGRVNPGGPHRPSVMKIRRGLLVAQEAGIPTLASQLSNVLGRMVLDKTGLAGKYDLKLEWQPDEVQVAMFQAMAVPEGYGAPAPDPLGPTLFTALQEQLGLKLESEKGPVEMLVVERVERPSAN